MVDRKLDDMRNNKGQALVEFILILPILLFIVMAFIDVATIQLSKYKLEDHLDHVASLYEEGKVEQVNQYGENKKIMVRIEENQEYAMITVSMHQTIHTPILKQKLGSNYKIETERMVYLYE